MSSNKVPKFFALPEKMATPVLPLKEFGVHLAQIFDVAEGHYDLVIEYKFGSTMMAVEPGVSIPAMGMTVTGLGLRHTEKLGPLTVTVPAKRAKKRASKTPEKP